MAGPHAEEITLLHNPRCSKSRAAKALLEERAVAFRERRYLDEPLSLDKLRDLARRLRRAAREWVRRGEAEYQVAKLDAESDDETLLKAMARFPILIERPILIRGPRAVIGRPPEEVLTLIE